MALFVSRYFFIEERFKRKINLLRGASLVPAETLKKQIVKQRKASDLNLDGFPLLQGAEVQHLLVHGTVGIGKKSVNYEINGLFTCTGR